MCDNTLYAYLAGAMDSDGSLGIKRHTYAMRVRGDATQAVYSERLSLKQVTPEVPHLLKETFGGRCAMQQKSTTNGRPLWGWDATDVVAATATAAIYPHLRIKRRQADAILELRHTKDDGRYQQFAYWWELDNPNWRTEPMLTFQQAADMIGYKGWQMVSQAVRNGSLVALPFERTGDETPRVPASLAAAYREHTRRARDNHGRCRPFQLIVWRERLWETCRQLNRIGTGEHPITMRTGCYSPA